LGPLLRPVWGCRQSQHFLFPYSPPPPFFSEIKMVAIDRTPQTGRRFKQCNFHISIFLGMLLLDLLLVGHTEDVTGPANIAVEYQFRPPT
jgi:hypothetical protein